MKKPNVPNNEKGRLGALYDYEVLDTIPEEEYDNITKIAADICNTPIALISLIDPARQWFKSHHGLNVTETPRELAFCAHAINTPNELFIVPDASKDERFFDNPLSTGEPNVVFYAGAPLNSPSGYPLGTLCVIDTKPRNLTVKQQETLKALAGLVISQLELRKKNKELRTEKKLTDGLNQRLNTFARRLSHDLKTPLRGIRSVSQWLKEDYISHLDEKASELINQIVSRSVYANHMIDSILDYSRATNEKLVFESFDLQALTNEILNNCINEGEREINLSCSHKTMVQSKIGVHQIIQNLLTNSIKYNDKAVCDITVDLIVEKDYYKITYEDNGPGVSLENKEKIFDLFETLGRKNNESTGIGMNIVKDVINRLDGSIELIDRSNNQQGVCFLLKLPKKSVRVK